MIALIERFGRFVSVPNEVATRRDNVILAAVATGIAVTLALDLAVVAHLLRSIGP